MKRGLSIGLTHLSEAQLERLLKAVHREQVSCPLDVTELHLAGLSDVADRVAALRDLDRRGVVAVLTAVLAERRRQGA
ncbi:MAG: hypothetical protein KC731_40590 [Myxococcales bacterium]|nr:hypothetical protein [Myxococcales bacterium]